MTESAARTEVGTQWKGPYENLSRKCDLLR
jgi:hypothetical protein